MFWSSATNSSNIEAILDQPDVTLITVLDQEEVLQESRSGNKKLLEYLLRADNMELMLDMITTEPSAETSLALQYKHPNIICEILTSDISFTEKIAGYNLYLEKLFHYFRDSSPPLNPLLGSYVCRVLAETVGRKLDQNWYSYQLNVIQIMGYLQSEVNLIEWLLNHLGTSAVCDFINKLIINMEGPDMRANLFQWMIEKENFIIRLMEKMKGDDRDVHANISRLVGDLLFAFRDDLSSANEADPFLEALRSPSTIEALNKAIFEDSKIYESSIIHGLDIILSLLGITKKPPKQPSRLDPLDEANNIQISPEIFKELTSRFKSLSYLLTDPPDLVSMNLTHGLVKNPLGSIRLTIAKFFAHISTLHSSKLMTCATKAGVLEKIMNLFWEHPWNNFLHRYVSKILIHIVRDPSPSMEALKMLIVHHNLLEKIVNVFEDSNIKCGYRGHLAKVAEVFTECGSQQGPFSTTLNMLHYQKQENWETFCWDDFEHYLDKQKILLAGAHPPSHGQHLSAPGLNYDSDPGMQWGGLAAMASSGLPSGFDSSDTFSAVDRFDDEKSKSLFEIFCADKSNSFALDEWADGVEDPQDSNDISAGSASGLGLTSDANLSPDAFTSVERFDSEKSKNLFDMFCNEKSSAYSVDDPWEDDFNEVGEVRMSALLQGIVLDPAGTTKENSSEKQVFQDCAEEWGENWAEVTSPKTNEDMAATGSAETKANQYLLDDDSWGENWASAPPVLQTDPNSITPDKGIAPLVRADADWGVNEDWRKEPPKKEIPPGSATSEWPSSQDLHSSNAQISFWNQTNTENAFGDEVWSKSSCITTKEDAENPSSDEKWADFDSFKEAINNADTQVPINEMQSENQEEVPYNSSQLSELNPVETSISEVKQEN